MKRAFSVGLCAGLLCLSAKTPIWAQTVPSLPGAIIESNRDPINNRPQSVDTVPGVTETAPQAAPQIQDQVENPELDPSLTRKIMVRQIVVEGAERLDPAKVKAITAPYENRESTLPELQENVADKLTALYEEQGCVTTLVFIPPQTIDNGVLKVQADEGRVREIVFEHGRFFKKQAVLPRIDLETGEIFDIEDLQRSLRRINENPDLTVEATLKAGTNPGDTNVVIRPNRENRPIHLTPFFDNLGRNVIGNNRMGATLNHNNLLGYGDTLFASASFTRESSGLLGGYELPIGAKGTKMGFSTAWSRFDIENGGFDFDGNARIYNSYLSQELYRTERAIVSTELGFSIKTSELDANGVDISKDQLTVLTPALNMQYFDSHGRTLMRHELGVGLHVLGARTGNTVLASRPGAGSQFVRYTGSVVRLQQLPWQTYGIFRALMQYSPDRLVSLEQFQAGGAATVRGYREGRTIGDSGFVLSGEWRLPAFIFSKDAVFPGTKYKLRDNIQFVTFGDFGGVFDNEAFSGVNSQSGQVISNAYLASVGVGLRGRISRFLQGRMDVAVPLIHLSPDRNSARIHFGLESTLF